MPPFQLSAVIALGVSLLVDEGNFCL